jgi:hypothetical protein
MYTPNMTTMGNVLTNQPYSYELSPLIGAPTRALTVQPGFNIRKEFTTVAEDHEGRVEHLAVFLGNLFAETENAFIFSLFTLRQFGDMNWMTTSWFFDSYIAQETPSQSPPPLGSYKKNVASGTLTRYAFGVQTLLDTLKDPDGDMIYYAMTVQALQSFVRAMEALVLTAMINTRAQYLAFWVEASDYTVNIASRAATEAVTWDALHRYADAVPRLTGLVQASFSQSQRGRATAVIVHEGFRSLVAASPQLTQYYLRGAGNQAFADRRAEAPGLQGKLLGTDIDIYVAAPINATGQGVFEDVLARWVEIGGWGGIDNYGWNLKSEDYVSTMYDTAMFDMSQDNFKTLTLPKALDWVGRFDTSAVGNLVPLHKQIAENVRTLATENKLAIVNDQVDMFIHAVKPVTGTSWKDCTHYGHMEAWALTPSVLRFHARTMRNFVERKMRKENVDSLYAGELLMKELADLPLTENDFLYFSLVQPAPDDGSTVSGAHFTGGPILPSQAILSNQAARENARAAAVAASAAAGDNAAAQKAAGDAAAAAVPAPVIPASGFKPRGFGSPAGMFALAMADPDAYPYVAPSVFVGARQFLVGAKAFYAAFLDIYGPDHPLLDPAYVPQAFASPVPGPDGDYWRSLVNFSHNMIAGNAQPILVSAVAADGVTPVDGFVPETIDPAAQPTIGAFARYGALFSEAPARVRQVIGNNANFERFVREFNEGPLGAAYLAYVAQKRREARDPTIQLRAIPNPFVDFFNEEIVSRFPNNAGPRDGKTGWAANLVGGAPAPPGSMPQNSYVFGRIMSQLISAADRKVEYTFDKYTLDALASGYENYAATKGRVAGDGSKFYSTRFVVTPERVYELRSSTPALATRIGIASSINNSAVAGQPDVVQAQLRSLQAGQNGDLSSQVVSTQAQPVRRQAVRTPFALGVGSAPYTPFADIGQDVVTDAFGKSTLMTNKNMLERITAARKEPDLILRVSALMAITAPIQKAPIVKMYEENVAPLVAVMCARPRRRYKTVAMIWLAVNDSLGMAAFALPDVRRGIDAARKSMFDHWTMYLGAVVMDPARIMIMPDVAIVGYDSGEDTTPVLPRALDDINESLSVARGSMYYILMPAGSLWGSECAVSPTMDLRGRFPHQIAQYQPGDRASIEFVQKARPHYSSALYTCVLYSLASVIVRSLPNELTFQAAATRKNTIIARELQMINLVPGAKTAVSPADHMGTNVFPGVKAIRTGGGFPTVVTENWHANTYFLPG